MRRDLSRLCLVSHRLSFRGGRERLTGRGERAFESDGVLLDALYRVGRDGGAAVDEGRGDVDLGPCDGHPRLGEDLLDGVGDLRPDAIAGDERDGIISLRITDALVRRGQARTGGQADAIHAGGMDRPALDCISPAALDGPGCERRAAWSGIYRTGSVCEEACERRHEGDKEGG